MPASNATSRFSDRVENYVRYRPGYPPAVLTTLQSCCGLSPQHRIADIASGTGIWTRTLLENGNAVWGVEPNGEMRQAGERLLAGYPNFTSVWNCGVHTARRCQRRFCDGRTGGALV